LREDPALPKPFESGIAITSLGYKPQTVEPNFYAGPSNPVLSTISSVIFAQSELPIAPSGRGQHRFFGIRHFYFNVIFLSAFPFFLHGIVGNLAILLGPIKKLKLPTTMALGLSVSPLLWRWYLGCHIRTGQ
jgi:hypothetical protein